MATGVEESSSSSSGHSLADKLTGKSRFLSYKLYAAIGALGLCLIIVSIALIYYLLKRRPGKKAIRVKHASGLIPLVSKEIIQLNVSDLEVNHCEKVNQLETRKSEESAATKQTLEGSLSSASSLSVMSSEVENIAWGRWYSLRELNVATDGFASDNVVGEGGYGVVYRGYLSDGSVVAVKKLLNNKGQAEKEFKVEVEAIGKVRHKNLVNLIGYCVEGVHRMLVYEYIDNGNLEQWLHGNVGPISPLTWDIRMRIAAGTAKGLAYLHEGLEPKVIHRDIKSSNILLDKKWNARVSDFGLAKLLEPETSHVTTRVMGTFGYVSPEYASTGLLCEGSDIYSFGVLLMEIISGRIPIDHSRPQGEVNLVNWFRGMIANRRGEEVVDPLLETQPSSRALKRALLVCLRCIDLDATKRPKMSQIVHMLEADEFSYHSEYRARRKSVETCVLPDVSKTPLMAQDSEVNRI